MGAIVSLGGLLLTGLLLKLLGLLADRQLVFRAAVGQLESVKTLRASHGRPEYLRLPLGGIHKGSSPRHLVTPWPPLDACRHRPDAGRGKRESFLKPALPSHKSTRAARGAVFLADGVGGDERAAVGQEGHVALRPG